MSENCLNAISLEVGYGSKNSIVKNISFEVKPGEVAALIGANGSGKSTVLKTIVKQLEILDGQIKICEVSHKDLSGDEMAKRVSMVMTERIHPELMTCFDVASTGRYPYTGRLGILSDADRAAVDDALKLVGALDVAGRSFAKVSDGQRQRVMLARAICQDTDIMILDEPTSFLDIQYKIDLLSIIKRLAREKNKAVVMSIHELEFVPAVADFVIGIAGGRVQKTGTPEEVLTEGSLKDLYGMAESDCKIMAEGLWRYAASLREVLCQRR